MRHELKILPAYFEAVQLGDKTFEIRDNADRGFQKGDTVLQREIRPGALADVYTGRTLERRITYVTNYGQKDGYVVFGISTCGPHTADLLQRAADAIDALFEGAGITNSEEREDYLRLIERLRQAQ